MTPPKPAPTGVEQPFSAAELFFSTTDRKAVITSGNEVFTRVAAYPRAEMIGQPHNLVRHPDMPRGVFRVFWDRLEAGRPVAAYVKNLAANGNHYWVLATVTPLPDGGYLSVRIKPTTQNLPVVESVYRALRSFEGELEAAGTPRKDVVARSVGRLGELLAGGGFASYDELERLIVCAELHARQAVQRPVYQAAAAHSRLGDALVELEAALGRVFSSLDRYDALEQGLDGKAGELWAMAETTRLSAVNTTIAASRLGSSGRVIATVADLLRREAGETTQRIRGAADAVDPTREVTGQVAVGVCLAMLQTEMARAFLYELARREDADPDAARNVRLLIGAVADSATSLDERLGSARGLIAELSQTVGAVTRKLRMLDALSISGRVEAASLGGEHAFATLFSQIQTEVSQTAASLASVAELADAARTGGEEQLERLVICARALTG